ncbi:MAG: hypothetical protein LCI00_11470 [Chloroflexi bacterium]|nr:hypothetical protein [Chloroflexota bacterium]
MSKRLLIAFIVMLLLALTSVASAQEAPSLTEERINQEFTIASTAARTISNLNVKVHEDGVYVSFDMTVTHDGTSNTLNIIAILIGQRVQQIDLKNSKISNFQATRSQRLEATGLVERSWTNYMDSAFGGLTTDLVLAEGIIMRDGGVCDPIRHMGC